ncbi:DUF5007 domain-containing protein [Arachidicoccus soli]|uniref:DUF5007 domain-containing protein n=1 Tax=Arachidicoccus soli TaxID=2341117 RepID=A0A386HRD7_9BACT|nr:DUF5007 domain-containing protein [Arachidicoccus soli]AYD48517.1 DUF5007 domain-containing protein [Arachidicoccus soli]
MNKRILIGFAIAFTLLLCISSCVKKYLPSDKDAIGNNARFLTTTYTPILGRNTLMTNNFDPGNSTQPLTFSIVNIKKSNGDPATELTDVFPVQIWKTAYTGLETSIAQIDSERTTEYHHLFEIREHSGEFLMWAPAKSSFVATQPDSGYVFDVEVSNSGGRQFFRNLRLKPLKEQPYVPSNLDPITGQATQAGVNPSYLTGIVGEHSDLPLGTSDVSVFFYKVGDGNTLTFKFLDTLYHPIDPHKFNTTNWQHLVHGFNMRMTDSSVTYDVAYPIPLVKGLKTNYTDPSGNYAYTRFNYSRIGFGGAVQPAELGFYFQLYEPGDWQIIFQFKKDNPKFEDE